MKTPAKPSPGKGQSIAQKISEIIDWVKSIVPVAGRGLRLSETSGGRVISLGQHGEDHLPGGVDPIVFNEIHLSDGGDPAHTTEIVGGALTLSDGGTPEKTIELDVAAASFLADRIYAVAADGNSAAWRTLLDLLDGLTGFAASKGFFVNSAGTGFEWKDPGSGTGDVTQAPASPFQNAKLVLGTSTAKELAGTNVGINQHGATYKGFSDVDIPTDARTAAIADFQFDANFPNNVIYGTASTTLYDLPYFLSTGLVSTMTLKQLLQTIFAASVGNNKVLTSTGTDFIFKTLTEIGVLPTGTVGQFLYHNGTNWIVLAKPTTDRYLRNNNAGTPSWETVDAFPASPVSGDLVYYNGTAWTRLARNTATNNRFLRGTSSGVLSWADVPTSLPQSSGGNGLSLVTSDGKIKTLYGG